MRVVEINYTGDPLDLKILFPALQVVSDGYPVYCYEVYSTFEYPIDIGKLFLLQSSKGIAIGEFDGLCQFLEMLDYFVSDSKLKRYKKYGSPQIKEGFRVVQEEGPLYKADNALRFTVAKDLQISNRTVFDQVSLFQGLADFQGSCLYDRLRAIDSVGSYKVLKQIFDELDMFYASQGSVSISDYKVRQIRDLLNGFDSTGFKSLYGLTGNADIDAYHLATYFR
jgi:hypothetical protein